MLMKPLALPRGLRQGCNYNDLAKSGTRRRSTKSLSLLRQVSHQHRCIFQISRKVAPSVS